MSTNYVVNTNEDMQITPDSYRDPKNNISYV